MPDCSYPSSQVTWRPKMQMLTVAATAAKIGLSESTLRAIVQRGPVCGADAGGASPHRLRRSRSGHLSLQPTARHSATPSDGQEGGAEKSGISRFHNWREIECLFQQGCRRRSRWHRCRPHILNCARLMPTPAAGDVLHLVALRSARPRKTAENSV